MHTLKYCRDTLFNNLQLFACFVFYFLDTSSSIIECFSAQMYEAIITINSNTMYSIHILRLPLEPLPKESGYCIRPVSRKM